MALLPGRSWRSGLPLGGARRPARRRGAWRVLGWALAAAATLMIVTASLGYSNNKLRRRKTYMTIAEITDAVYRFHHDFQRYPDSFAQLLVPPAGQTPYLAAIPEDAWGNRFLYERVLRPGVESFQVISSGPDGKPGTDDDIENL